VLDIRQVRPSSVALCPSSLALCLFRDFDTIVDGRRIAEQLTELSAFQRREAGTNLEAGGSAETRGLLRLSTPPKRVRVPRQEPIAFYSPLEIGRPQISGFVVVYGEAGLQLRPSVNFGDLLHALGSNHIGHRCLGATVGTRMCLLRHDAVRVSRRGYFYQTTNSLPAAALSNCLDGRSLSPMVADERSDLASLASWL
jgi:hypothetical protein